MNYFLIVIGIIAALLLILFFNKIRKKRIKRKNMAVLAEDKLREEALDKIILNENAKVNKGDTHLATPFEVNYDANRVEKQNNHKGRKKRKTPKTMVQIVENSELSARKYMFDPQKGIHIGSKAGKNHIVVNDTNIDDRQCEILESIGKIYVHNIGGSGKVILNRGKQNAYVETKFIELKTGDTIKLGKTVFKIDVIKTNEK